MHLLVTGGTGFFGKALLRYWSLGIFTGHTAPRITLLSRNPDRFLATHGNLLSRLDIRIVYGDILNPKSMPSGDYTHLLHAATDSTAGIALQPLERFDQIVVGTRNVLDLALRCGKPRVLLTSSGGVYGNIGHFTKGVVEDYYGIPDPLDPHNAYSLGKRQAEHLCALYHHEFGLEYVIARCFAFIGEDLPLDAHFAIGNFIGDVLAGRDILIQGDGTQVRSYMDQRDLARWLTALLMHAPSQRVYNIGSDEATSIAELASKVVALAPGHNKSEIRVMKHKSSGQSANRNFYVPNISRAKNELGLCIDISLDAAIKKIFELKAVT
jgi:UDP-glucuronate decarboxylase